MSRSLLLLFIAACSRSPESTPPVVAVEPISTSRPITSSPSAALAEPSACQQGFVEIDDAGKTVRYELGREIVPGKRGAKHAFVEEVLHRNGEVVLSISALARADGHGGHVSIAVRRFEEPASTPAVYGDARVLYMPLGQERERDERTLESPRVEITKWGPEGSWVEGTFGPDSTGPYRGRFRVCRTADWHVKL